MSEEISTDDGTEAPEHTHPRVRRWPWLVAAAVVCPCHLPLLLALAGTGALGGALARNYLLLLAGLAAAFALALWRGLSAGRRKESCPACRVGGAGIGKPAPSRSRMAGKVAAGRGDKTGGKAT